MRLHPCVAWENLFDNESFAGVAHEPWNNSVSFLDNGDAVVFWAHYNRTEHYKCSLREGG